MYDIDFLWCCSKIAMVIYNIRYLVAKNLAAGAKNPVTIFPLRPNNQLNWHKPFPAFGFDYDFDLWTSVNMQLDAKNVVGADRLNRALSYVFFLFYTMRIKSF